MTNTGKWIKDPRLYEIGSEALPAAQYARLKIFSSIDRGRAIVNDVG